MRAIRAAVLLLLVASDTLAAPTPARRQSTAGSFKVDRIRRRAAHGPTALQRAYAKYGILPTNLGFDLLDFELLPPPNSSSNSMQDLAQPGATGAVHAMAVQGGAEFVSPVVVGGQKLVMDFDTGSSDMWLINTNLPAADQQGHMVFDPAQSKTFEPLPGAEFNITYGDQSFANGPVGTDTVDIGGATVTRQAIGVPTQVSQSFIQDTSSNGLVGLAFSNINTVRPQQQETFFANVAPSLDLPVMTAALRADGGIYEFGRIDAAKFTGQMVNVSVDPANGFWQFESAQFAVGNGPLQPIQTTQTAIADTGTTLMLSSPEVVQAYYAQVQGAVLASAAGGYIYPCAAQLPDLSVAVGSQNLATIPGSMISFSKIGMNTTTGQPVCFGGLQSNQGSALQIYGDVFLRSMFVVFDRRGPSLGLASPA